MSSCFDTVSKFWDDKKHRLSHKVNGKMVTRPISKRRKYSEITTVLRRSRSLPNVTSENLEQFVQKHSKRVDSYDRSQDAEDCNEEQRQLLCRANSNAQVQYILIRDAIKENNRLDLINLLTRKHADINELAVDGLSAIHVAAEQGTQQILEILVSKGASINMRSGNGDYPLDLAVKAGNYEIAQFLIDKGARLDNVINGTPPSKPKREKTKRRSNTISVS